MFLFERGATGNLAQRVARLKGALNLLLRCNLKLLHTSPNPVTKRIRVSNNKGIPPYQPKSSALYSLDTATIVSAISMLPDNLVLILLTG